MTAAPPLLMLAEGRKPRVRKAPVIRPREIKLHVTVADLLRDHCLPDWRWRHINAKAKDAREGAILKKMGANPGWADFILISPQGSVRFLELKRLGEDEDRSEAQQEFRLWCIRCGIQHVVAETIEQVLAAFDIWGCLRVKLG